MNDVGKQEHKEKKAAVILAAGSGRRMNTPVAKQFLDLMGIPVFLHSVRLFDKIADKIVLVTSPDAVEYCQNLLEKEELCAGLVNGKNIWKNHYGKTLKVINALKAKNINVVLNTSCSLLHVPYTLKNETKLPEKYTEHFAFAEEKLQELAELKKLADVDYKLDAAFLENTFLFATRPDCRNLAVQKRVAAIRDRKSTRLNSSHRT